MVEITKDNKERLGGVIMVEITKDNIEKFINKRLLYVKKELENIIINYNNELNSPGMIAISDLTIVEITHDKEMIRITQSTYKDSQYHSYGTWYMTDSVLDCLVFLKVLDSI